MEERKLTLRNHVKLMASELDDAMLKVASIIDDIDANPDETIDDDIYTALQNLLNELKYANDAAWELENLCQEREMGKRRFE